jgi:Sulfotransferase domain
VTGSQADPSLPTFVVIGAMKAGTTTLHAWLDVHPDVCMSAQKELDFFLTDGNWDRGVDWYRDQFAACGGERARGESSPNYSKTHLDPGVPARMHSVLPDARLVYLVREPIARMRSMYRHLAIDGTETRSFAEAVAADPDYRETSRYLRHVDAFLEHFARESLLVVSAEQLEADPAGTLVQVHGHIGVEPLATAMGTASRNVTADRTVDTALGRRLEAVPAYWRALNRSWRLRRAHARVFTRPATIPPAELPADFEDELRADLEPDTAGLEAFLGRRLTEWGR